MFYLPSALVAAVVLLFIGDDSAAAAAAAKVLDVNFVDLAEVVEVN